MNKTDADTKVVEQSSLNQAESYQHEKSFIDGS